MITWQFLVLMIVIYSCADRIGDAIEKRKNQQFNGFGGENKMEDRLVIGYDNGAKRGDISCLQVLRKKGRGYEVVKTFCEEDAEELYKKLIEHNQYLKRIPGTYRRGIGGQTEN